MMSAQEITLFLYNLTLIPVVFFSILFLVFAFLNLFAADKKKILPFSGKYPFISVQIPTYNDAVASECIKKCIDFDYPKNRYEIIIADDSTDKAIASELRSFTIYPGVKYIHRTNREGFKPGALKNAMKITKGEILVLFDSDWRPEKDFLKKIIKPIMDEPDIAIVQAKQTFVNMRKNLISRFSAYILMIYHSLFMPLHKKANTVFFCGTAGAIRRDVFEKMGGWNVKSITEDADLSIKMLSNGYRTEYLNMEVPSEVPETIEGFIKQQMRWCYGLTRAFIDNFKEIFSSKKLTFAQRLMISYTTLGNIVAPIVLLMTFFGMMGWFLGDPQIFRVTDLYSFALKFIYTSGFLVLGVITLYKENHLVEFPYLLLSTFTVSLLLLAFNSLAFLRAVFNKEFFWYRTPKTGHLIKNEF